MANLFISNAFSTSMLKTSRNLNFHLLKDSFEASLFLIDRLREGFGIVSAVGHADTASLFKTILLYPVEMNRVKISLEEGDMILCGQLDTGGQRLPEGCTTLPENAKIRWWIIAEGNLPIDFEELLQDIRREDTNLKRWYPCGIFHRDDCQNLSNYGCEAERFCK